MLCFQMLIFHWLGKPALTTEHLRLYFSVKILHKNVHSWWVKLLVAMFIPCLACLDPFCLKINFVKIEGLYVKLIYMIIITSY